MFYLYRYIGGNHDCDTHIPAIDLHIENVAVFPTPHSLKVKLYGVRRVDQKVQGFYKGKLRIIYVNVQLSF